MLERSGRYRSRLLAGRLLLVLAVLLYVVALVVPVGEDTHTKGWESYKGMLDILPVIWEKPAVVAASVVVGMLYVNILTGVAALALALGRVGFARLTGPLSLVTFWIAFWVMVANRMVIDPPSVGLLAWWLSGFRGGWLWVASLHVVALAAFVTPRRPRQPDAN